MQLGRRGYLPRPPRLSCTIEPLGLPSFAPLEPPYLLVTGFVSLTVPIELPVLGAVDELRPKLVPLPLDLRFAIFSPPSC